MPSSSEVMTFLCRKHRVNAMPECERAVQTFIIGRLLTANTARLRQYSLGMRIGDNTPASRILDHQALLLISKNT